LDFIENDRADCVYGITKTVLENKAALKPVHPRAEKIRLFTKEESVISPASLHPGVLKYAEEVGMKY
jgi:TRAP-type uncharacterized transport system substrate-binding protein